MAVVLLLLAGGAVALFRNAGYWLEAPDAVRVSRAIVVLGGGAPFRAIEAAQLYRRGLAKEIWVTQGAPDLGDLLVAKLGMAVSHEHERSEAVLEALGVPRTAMREVPDLVDNTVTELRAVSHFAGADTRPLILVSSKYHVRRVRIIWGLVNGSGAHPAAIVLAAADDPYDAGHWWHSSTDALSTFRELFGIANAWAGFPVEPRDR